MSPKNAILDAGPIIHLDEINCLHFLIDFNKLIVPSTVWYEIESHRPSVFEHKDINFYREHIFEKNKDVHIMATCRLFCLDPSETEAIVLCSYILILFF